MKHSLIILSPHRTFEHINTHPPAACHSGLRTSLKTPPSAMERRSRRTYLKGLSTIASRMDRLMKTIREGIRGMGVNFSVAPVTGMPAVSPVFGRALEDGTIDELYALIENLSQKKRLVVAFDAFQEVASYGGDAFEKVPRRSIQKTG